MRLHATAATLVVALVSGACGAAPDEEQATNAPSPSPTPTESMAPVVAEEEPEPEPEAAGAVATGVCTALDDGEDYNTTINEALETAPERGTTGEAVMAAIVEECDTIFTLARQRVADEAQQEAAAAAPQPDPAPTTRNQPPPPPPAPSGPTIDDFNFTVNRCEVTRTGAIRVGGYLFSYVTRDIVIELKVYVERADNVRIDTRTVYVEAGPEGTSEWDTIVIADDPVEPVTCYAEAVAGRWA